MIDKFIEILRDLLPNKEQPNSIWVVRLFSVASISLMFFLVFTFLLQNTPLGDKLGITRQKSGLPTLNQTELIFSMRESWRELSVFRDSSPNEIQDVFVVFIARKKDGNILNSATISEKRVYPLIWVWNVSSKNSNVSLRIVEDSFQSSLEDYRTILSQKKTVGSRYCFSSPLKDSFSLGILKRGIIGFNANYVVSCGIYSKSDETIGATIAYIKIDSPLPSLPPPSALSTDILLYSIQDKLKTSTDVIETKYNDMSVDYQFRYNSRP